MRGWWAISSWTEIYSKYSCPIQWTFTEWRRLLIKNTCNYVTVTYNRICIYLFIYLPGTGVCLLELSLKAKAQRSHNYKMIKQCDIGIAELPLCLVPVLRSRLVKMVYQWCQRFRLRGYMNGQFPLAFHLLFSWLDDWILMFHKAQINNVQCL
jgi:hypothetical protein